MGLWGESKVVVLSYSVAVLTSLSDKAFFTAFSFFFFLLHPGHFHLLAVINKIKKEIDRFCVHESVK